LREEHGFSQESFAVAAGIDRSYYGRIERGTANPTLKNIQAIADVLEITISQLFAGLSADRTSKSISGHAATARVDSRRRVGAMHEPTEKSELRGSAKSGNAPIPIDIHQRLRQWQNLQCESLALAQEEAGNIANIANNFDNLGQDDFFIYASSISPYEMSDQDSIIKMSIAGALYRGAVLIYVRQKDELPSEIQLEFDKFAAQVFSHLRVEEIAIARERLILIQSEDNPFLAMPGAKWDLFLTGPQDGELSVRGGSMIPAGPANEMNILIPQTSATALQLLYSVAREACNASSTQKSRLPGNILERLKERTERLTGLRLAI